MIDSVKIKLIPTEIDFKWNIGELKEKLQPVEKYDYNRDKPLGRIRNMYLYGNSEFLIIEGSLAKYYNINNIENFNWRFIRNAISNLSQELGLPLERGRLTRIDVGVNIELDKNVTDYFPEIFFLEYYQRITRNISTLRFENNTHKISLLFYDKLKEFVSKEKLIKDIDLGFITDAENLMRIELQIQERVSQILKTKDVRVSCLFQTDFCRLLMRNWLDLYQNIYKKSVLSYPKSLKGNADFEKFLKRYFVQDFGWERLDYLMKKAVKQGSLTASNKSKKLKQFRVAMLDNSSFEFQEHTLELNHKVKVMYVEALKQIYRIN
ncbi:phage/plasmid replication protein [Flavobacterium sp.]|uniref:phage/plasmid replication domain-containing protein n=1 Tax=Flavobacterium sp. TaxID=239 RepID=UPI0026232D67|nr:phage/plasmid replication protein [Flavobacterium sp.]